METEGCARNERGVCPLRVELVRGRFDKCLASPPEGAAIARDVLHRVVHSRGRLLSKFGSNRTRNFVLNACGNGRVRGFYKSEKRTISVGDLSCFWKGNRAAKSKSAWMLCTGILLRRWRPLKIRLKEFQRRRTSVFDEPRPGAPKTKTATT